MWRSIYVQWSVIFHKLSIKTLDIQNQVCKFVNECWGRKDCNQANKLVDFNPQKSGRGNQKIRTIQTVLSTRNGILFYSPNTPSHIRPSTHQPTHSTILPLPSILFQNPSTRDRLIQSKLYTKKPLKPRWPRHQCFWEILQEHAAEKYSKH
jgi:hypothetical protein